MDMQKGIMSLLTAAILIACSGNIGRAEELTREDLDKKYWQQEILAQEHEERFVALWDDMRRADDKFDPLEKFPFTTLVLPTEKNERQLELDVLAAEYVLSEEKTYTREEFLAALDRLKDEGYFIEQLEFHHGEFRPKGQEKATSVFSFLFHVKNNKTRFIHDFNGLIEVTWQPEKDAAGLFVPDQIKVIKLKSLKRDGRIPALSRFYRLEETYRIGNNPVLLYDFDQKGYSDVVLPSLNLILRNNEGAYSREKLFEKRIERIASAVVGEFTGDKYPDLFVTSYMANPQLYKGVKGGKFDPAPNIIDLTKEPQLLKGGFNALTAGDIDQDGDLDLFLGSYIVPYNNGTPLPVPFYDANDGEPAYLLQNDGQGNFKDITVEAGLGPKRFRLSYAASFADLDQDRDMDLVVVSDFSGVDVYENDGSGVFQDVTDTNLDNRSLFGMAHTFGDFNVDGKMDLYVTGMSSTTARRLNKMGISLEEFQDIQAMMMPMAYGNRMYYGDDQGVFRSAPNNDQVARTGWAWGTSGFDLDNDGDLELYIANGNISQSTAKDYCTFFWRQDIFVKELDTAAMDQLLGVEGGSWNGFEHNVLFLNERGENFTNTAYMFDVAFEFDSRGVVSEDFNLDGRTDLILSDVPGNVYFLKNDFETGNHWVGVRLQHDGPGSPLGTRVVVSTEKGEQTWQFISGDSYIAQHAAKRVFGLGGSDEINYIEVQWFNGKKERLDRPKADRYYAFSSSGG